MLAPFRSAGIRPYAFGIIGVVIASLLRSYFDPYLGEHLSFSFDYLAVFVAAWTGGVWPAIATAIVSALVSNYFFTDPYLSLEISSIEELLDLIFFVVVSVVIGILSEVSLRALARAKKAEKEKDNFMASVAHELRSPLSVIHYANSLNRMTSAEQASDQLDVIDRQVYLLNVLIEDLLDVSRVARGKIRLRLEHADASTIVRGAVEKARLHVEGHGHTLALDVSPEPMPLYVDPARIEQVLTNLLTNAAKYTPEGGKIVVHAEPADGSAVISVEDNGIGISPEMLPRVFDLFAQDDAGRERREGGLGIGLAIARKIAEMHGGRLSAESAGTNCGSQFFVTLPLEQAAAQRLQAAM
jgi:signal transduction histidine kinase